MAAFSYQQYHPLFLDSVFMPTSPPHLSKNIANMAGFVEEGNIGGTACFPHFFTSAPPDHYQNLLETYPPHSHHHHDHVHGFHASSQVDDHSFKTAALSDNEASLTGKQSTESSTVVDKLESGEQVTQNVTPVPGKKRKNNNGSPLNSALSKDVNKQEKSKKQKKCNGKVKEQEKKPKADEKKVPEESPTGYIHVRARRGQATDSHSLAERVRREKISERMKILQRLVPGCDKVTGKALMLDEIINYVQSLQNQVEFLSMKLASVSPLLYEFGADLGAVMVRPERLNCMASPLPALQQCSPIQATAFADANTISTTAATTTTTTTATTTATTINNYPVLDGSTSLFLHGQDSGSCLFWDADEQRQKLLIPSGFAHNLCSFH